MKKTVKTYTEMNNLKRAVRAAGLHLIQYRVEEREEMGPRGRMRTVFAPIFMPELDEDVVELQSRGWLAESGGQSDGA